MTLASLDLPRCREVFADLSEGFDRALASRPAGAVSVGLRFGGLPVRLRTAGPRCLANLLPAFEHLRCDDLAGEDIALDIDMWCETETPSGLERLRALDEETWCMGTEDGRFVGIARADYTGVIDRIGKRILVRTPNSDAFPNFQRAKPFLYVLAVWYNDRDLFTIHGGLIAQGDRAALVTGVGGAGKSTVCVASLEGGLSFLGDDHVAVEPHNGEYLGHSMFASLQLASDHVARFPDTARLGRPGRTIVFGKSESGQPLTVKEKSVVQVGSVLPDRALASARIAAVVLPRFDPHGRETRIERVGGAEAFLALVPGTLENLYSSYKRFLPRVSEMLRQVPCFRLHTTPDLPAIPRAIREILEGNHHG